MCGIVGFFAKDGKQAEIGRTILGMVQALGCRGPDSTGVALFGAPDDGRFVVRVKLGDEGDLEPRARQIAGRLETVPEVSHFSTTASYARFLVGGETDLNRLSSSIESLDKDFEVVSIGHRLEIVKQTGSPENLEKTYRVATYPHDFKPTGRKLVHNYRTPPAILDDRIERFMNGLWIGKPKSSKKR